MGPGGAMGTGGPPPYSAAAAARLKRPLPMPEAPDDKSRIKEEPAPSAPKRMNMGPAAAAAAAGPKQPGQPVIKTEAEEVAVKSEGPSVASGQSSVRYIVMYTVLDNF